MSGGRQWAGGGPPRPVCDPPWSVCDHFDDGSSYFHCLTLKQGDIYVNFAGGAHIDKIFVTNTAFEELFLKDSSMHVVLSLSLILKVIYFCKFDKQGLFNDVSYAVEICEQTMISAKITSNFYDV